jgi:putative transposase
VSCYRLIDQEKAHHTVSRLARVLGVARAGYYAWSSRPASARTLADQALTEQIRQIHARSRGTYGAPRARAELRLGLDLHVGRKRVARLMRAAGLQGCHRRRRHGLTRRDPQAVPAPDLVQRNFAPPAPDRLWVADITQQRTDEGWLYVAVVLDCFSRRIVGWSMADHLRTELVLDALDMAIAQRNPAPGLVHHADHGCQYTSLAFGRRLHQAGLAASMGSVGDALDNAVAESFFATLECELLDRYHWPTRLALRSAVFDFIEVFYNRQRRHSTLAYLTPVDYEHHSSHHQHPPHSQRVHESGATPIHVPPAIGVLPLLQRRLDGRLCRRTGPHRRPCSLRPSVSATGISGPASIASLRPSSSPTTKA